MNNNSKPFHWLAAEALGILCFVKSDDGTGIMISEEAIIPLFVVEKLDRSIQ